MLSCKNLIILVLLAAVSILSASQTDLYPGLETSSQIILNSARGAKLEEQANIRFSPGLANGTVINVFPQRKRQIMDGIGSSFTESSAFVLAHLDSAVRAEVMRKIYSEDGANFSLTRTHIGSCDFSVEGKYSYAEQAGDGNLDSFSIAPDLQGFDPETYPGIKDSSYDLLPMIKEALGIKANQRDQELRIVASAWTAPPWMKDIGDWYIPGAPENNWQGTGGSLLPEYEAVYADYLIKYLDAYADQGIQIWGLTPVNEPHGNNGQWESMSFSPQSQGLFIKRYLGPKLASGGHAAKKLLIYDQNRDGMEEWADQILSDPAASSYVYGTAIHWYESTFKVYEDVLDRVHYKFPDFTIMHTEGCIDDLGKDPPGGVTDPQRFKESGWFDNDEFWWSKTATDWAYSVTWQGVNVEDHPIYVPVHRYARNIIQSINHWATGWIDWNVVLDRDGGPNHVGNYCGAPIMIDTDTGYVYYTPVYDVLSQFSRSIRPGDVAVETRLQTMGLGPDDLYACATVSPDGMLSIHTLNTSQEPISCSLQIGDRYASLHLEANSVYTIKLQIPETQQ